MIDNLIRRHFKDFQPYRSARSEAAAPQGKSGKEIFLDANELSTGSPVSHNGLRLNRYPDPLQLELRGKIARRLGVTPAEIFLGVGSDEIIDLLVRLFCDPGEDMVAILGPTYGVYRVAASVNAVGVVDVELDRDFQIDLDATLGAMSSAKLLFCCSPNNPTGNLLNAGDIRRLCEQFKGIVVVDQAYVDFSSSDVGAAAAIYDIRNGLQNLVVLRTFSKGWGLAGIRLGYCIAPEPVVSYLLRIKSPYNISSVTSRIASDALEKKGFLRASIRRIVRERERLGSRLRDIRGVVRVYPSDANFLLVEFRDSLKAFDRLKQAGIVVRRRTEPRLQHCLRITVGTAKENKLLVQILRGLT